MPWTPEQRREYQREYARRRRQEPEYAARHRAAQQRFSERHPGYWSDWYRARLEADPEFREKQTAYKRRNRADPKVRERERETARRWRQANPDKRAAQERKSRYGLTAERYTALLEAQGGGCALCGRKKPLHVDHDHACCSGDKSCGECVRGLLCNHCNNGLGCFNDNPELLMAAVKYLANAPARAGR